MSDTMTDAHYDWVNQFCGVDLRANASSDSGPGQPTQSAAPPASETPQTPAATPNNPSGLTPEQLKRLQEGDKPVEYDPVGQAILGGVVGGVIGAAKEIVVGGVEWGVEAASTAIGEGLTYIGEKIFDANDKKEDGGGAEGVGGAPADGDSQPDGGTS